MTSATRAIEAIGDPWLEHVVVGRSICLHQPVTRAVALLPDAAHDGTDTRLPERAELMAAGLLTPQRASSSPQTTIGVGAGRSPVERPVVIGRYQLSGGAVVVLTCDCAWLGPRLQAVGAGQAGRRAPGRPGGFRVPGGGAHRGRPDPNVAGSGRDPAWHGSARLPAEVMGPTAA